MEDDLKKKKKEDELKKKWKMNQKKMEANLKKINKKKMEDDLKKNKKNEDDINNKKLFSIPLKFRPNLSWDWLSSLRLF